MTIKLKVIFLILKNKNWDKIYNKCYGCEFLYKFYCHPSCTIFKPDSGILQTEEYFYCPNLWFNQRSLSLKKIYCANRIFLPTRWKTCCTVSYLICRKYNTRASKIFRFDWSSTIFMIWLIFFFFRLILSSQLWLDFSICINIHWWPTIIGWNWGYQQNYYC